MVLYLLHNVFRSLLFRHAVMSFRWRCVIPLTLATGEWVGYWTLNVALKRASKKTPWSRKIHTGCVKTKDVLAPHFHIQTQSKHDCNEKYCCSGNVVWNTRQVPSMMTQRKRPESQYQNGFAENLFSQPLVLVDAGGRVHTNTIYLWIRLPRGHTSVLASPTRISHIKNCLAYPRADATKREATPIFWLLGSPRKFVCLKDAAGTMDLSETFSFLLTCLLHQRVRKCPTKQTIPTPENIKQLHWKGNDLENGQPPKRDSEKMMHPANCPQWRRKSRLCWLLISSCGTSFAFACCCMRTARKLCIRDTILIAYMMFDLQTLRSRGILSFSLGVSFCDVKVLPPAESKAKQKILCTVPCGVWTDLHVFL